MLHTVVASSFTRIEPTPFTAFIAANVFSEFIKSKEILCGTKSVANQKFDMAKPGKRCENGMSEADPGMLNADGRECSFFSIGHEICLRSDVPLGWLYGASERHATEFLWIFRLCARRRWKSNLRRYNVG